MASMILEVYDAFRSIGIDDEQARKAAGALSDNPRAIADLRTEMMGEFANVRSEFIKVRSEMTAGFADVRSEMKEGFAKLRTEQVVVRTLLGILVSLVLLLAGGELTIWSKLGEISARIAH